MTLSCVHKVLIDRLVVARDDERKRRGQICACAFSAE